MKLSENPVDDEVFRLRALSQMFLIKSMILSGVLQGTNELEVMQDYIRRGFAEFFDLLASGSIELNGEYRDLKAEFQEVVKKTVKL